MTLAHWLNTPDGKTFMSMTSADCTREDIPRDRWLEFLAVESVVEEIVMTDAALDIEVPDSPPPSAVEMYAAVHRWAKTANEVGELFSHAEYGSEDRRDELKNALGLG